MLFNDRLKLFQGMELILHRRCRAHSLTNVLSFADTIPCFQLYWPFTLSTFDSPCKHYGTQSQDGLSRMDQKLLVLLLQTDKILSAFCDEYCSEHSTIAYL